MTGREQSTPDGHEGPGWHIAAIAALLIVVAIRYFPSFTTLRQLGDEEAYLCAFKSIGDGRSPYECNRYVYPAPVAELGALLSHVAGARVVQVGMRIINGLGAAVAVWAALGWVGWAYAVRLTAGMILVLFAPPIQEAMEFGNLSPLATGLALAAFALWTTAPIAAGVLLGLGTVVKPIVGAGVVMLIFHRPTGTLRRRSLTAGVIAGIVISGLLATTPRLLPEMLRKSALGPNASHNITPYHLLHCFGIDLPAFLFSGIALAAGAIAAWTQVFTSAELVAVSVVVAQLGAPSVFNHTLLLVLPVPILAFDAALRRVQGARTAGAAERTRSLVACIVAVIGAGVILASDVFGEPVLDLSPWQYGLLALVPTLSPAFLAVMFVRASRHG